MAAKDKGSENFSPTLTVNGMTYAVSLFWQPLQSNVNPLPEIRESAKTLVEGADLFCIRKSGAQQYAIGSTGKGHKPGLPVAAAILADILSDRHSSLAVFKVNEGWWFVVIRNDLILSEEEVLYKKEEDAKQAFMAMLAVPDWGRKIAPENWKIDGAQDIDLAKLFRSRKHRVVKLQRLEGDGGKKFLIFVAVLICILGIGTYWGMTYLFPPDKKPKRVVRALPPPVVKEEDKKEAVPEQPTDYIIEYTKPYDELKDPVTYVSGCQMRTLELREIFFPGYNLVTVACADGNANARWQRYMGNYSWLRRIPNLPVLKRFPEFSYAISEDGSSITGSFKLDQPILISSEPNMTHRMLVKDLSDFSGIIKQQITVGQGNKSIVVTPRVEKPVPGVAPPQDVTFNFPYATFSFTSPMEPVSWKKFFTTYAGLEVQKITYNMASKAWSYEGVIYEKPE